MDQVSADLGLGSCLRLSVVLIVFFKKEEGRGGGGEGAGQEEEEKISLDWTLHNIFLSLQLAPCPLYSMQPVG